MIKTIRTSVFVASVFLPLVFLPSIAHGQIVRTTETVSGATRQVIYVKGLSPQATATLSQTGGLTSSARLANACGVVRLNRPTAGWNGSITVNGGNPIDPNGFPTLLTVPTCVGSTLTPSQTENFRDANANAYIIGLTPNTAATIGLPSNSSRTAKANGCGFARFLASSTAPWANDASLNINGTVTTYSAITQQSFPPYCRNVGSGASPSYVLYEAVP